MRERSQIRCCVARWLCTFCAMVVALTCEARAIARNRDAQAAQETSAQPATTTLAGQIELARLVDLAAQRLKLNVEYDAAALKTPVTLRLEAGLTDDELWLLVNRVLVSRGYTTVRMPGKSAYSVVKLQDAASLAGTTMQLPASESQTAGAIGAEPSAGFITTVVRAQHRTTKDLVDQLNKVLGKSGSGAQGTTSGSTGASAMGDTGLILIADLQSRVERAIELLKVLDTPAAQTVVREVALKHISAAQMVTLLGQVNAKQESVSGERAVGDVIATPDGNSLLVIAPEAKQEIWSRLIADLDKREEVVTATYTPRHFSTEEVASLIEQTVRDGGGTSVTGASAGSDPRWRVVTDPLTASLVITATPNQHTQIQDLLTRLDSVPASSRRPVRSFVIKNRGVAEIRNILEDLLRSGVLAAWTSDNAPVNSEPRTVVVTPEPATSTPMPPAPSSPTRATRAGSSLETRSDVSPAATSHATDQATRKSQFGGVVSRSVQSNTMSGYGGGDQPLVMTIDEGTNTLIAVGEPRILAQIEALLKTLDVRQPQVMLEVLMVTLTEDQTLSFGMELEELTISNDVRIRLSSLFGLGGRDGSGDRIGPLNASGFTGVVLSPGDFSVIVRALERLNNGRSVSMPKLLVGNNQSASINSVIEQPFASVNASNTISTTSYGGSSDAGTVVTIRPQIAQGDHMNLDYSVSLSSFVGAASDPTLPPPRQENEVQSIATIPDGHTVVVGGIEVQTDSKSISQIPFVGSIPVVGEAFKSRSKSNSRSRFYVFIRANILRSRGNGGDGFEGLRYISTRDAAAARVDDGFPEVQPRVIR